MGWFARLSAPFELQRPESRYRNPVRPLRSSYRRTLHIERLEERQLLAASPSISLASHADSSLESANSLSSSAVVSADGRYVAFVSDATNLVSGITLTPGVENVYRYDRATGDIDLVSIGHAGLESGDRDSRHPGISADGNVITFSSASTNLHALDTSTNGDVFARNLLTGTTHLISINRQGTASANGHSDYPAISADGNTVAFRSTSNLEAIDADTFWDIYARDLSSGTTQLVSVNAAGNGSGNRPAYTPLISANGNVVVYLTQSNNLHISDTDLQTDLFARDLATGTTHLVSINAAGDGSADAVIATPSINSDGTKIAFQSRASNLHPLDTEPSDPDGSADIFVRDLSAGITHLVSINAMGTASASDSESIEPVISADGNVVAFSSAANDLMAGLGSIGTNIFARNLATGTTYLVSATTTGSAIADGERNWDPLISADGNIVVFESDASNLHALDTDFDPEDDIDVFARNLATGTTQLISVNASGSSAGNGPSFEPTINSDGSVIAFLSDASDLVDNDFNGLQDVFVSSLAITPPQLPGDYNGNGTVDAADYVLWRMTLNQPARPPYAGADGNGSGMVDEDDYGMWREHFGETLPVQNAAVATSKTGALAGEPVDFVAHPADGGPLSGEAVPQESKISQETWRFGPEARPSVKYRRGENGGTTGPSRHQLATDTPMKRGQLLAAWISSLFDKDSSEADAGHSQFISGDTEDQSINRAVDDVFDRIGRGLRLALRYFHEHTLR